jgi:hypothetical protein
MAGKKQVISEELAEILLDYNSDENLIPELESSDNEDESQEIGMESDVCEISEQCRTHRSTIYSNCTPK